jgi:hypothetical protein
MTVHMEVSLAIESMNSFLEMCSAIVRMGLFEFNATAENK